MSVTRGFAYDTYKFIYILVNLFTYYLHISKV